MQAIATLVNDDPYLKLSRGDRLAALKARRERLFKLRGPLLFEPCPVVEIPPVPAPVYETWTDRQHRIHKQPWFSIECEIAPKEPLYPSIQDIQRVCCAHYGISRTLLVAERRFAQVVKVRQIGMYLCKEMTPRSLPDIGRRFGNRDHTTVLHAVRKIDHLASRDDALAAEIKILRTAILESIR